MGLASSQARLLNLTSRMHQIEYKAAKLEAEKLQMANESKQVYETYLEALESTKVQYKVLSTDGAVTYHDINSYADFIAAGYAIDFKGKVYDGEKVVNVAGDKYKEAGTITLTDADVAEGGAYHDSGLSAGTYYVYSNGTDKKYTTTQIADGATSATFAPATSATDITTTFNDYAQLCADAFGADVTAPPTNVSEVITNLINSGDVTLVQVRKDTNIFAVESDPDFEHFETSVATNTGLREVNDEVKLKKAEAQYEADMRKIDMKDRRFDHDLAALDAERNAIKQEMETLKSVAKENVERTFKLFS